MPTIVQIGNLRIRIFADDHNPPHFHVLTPEHEALVRFDDLTILRGSLRRVDFAIAATWARKHMKEFLDEWERLNGRD